MKHLLALGVCLLAFVPAPLAAQTAAGAGKSLTVVSAGPTGEVASLAEANEIRIVFSEPMVTLGRIPAVVRPPFVTITPAIPGAFRWSGTTILIFTPDAKPPLPFATRYDVTIDATAAAVSGRTLARAVHLHVHDADGEAAADRDCIGAAAAPTRRSWSLLRFNQPVEPADVAAHLTARVRAARVGRRRRSPQEAQQRLAAHRPDGAERASTPRSRPRDAVGVVDRAGGAAADERLGQEALPAVAEPRGVRDRRRAVPPESWVKLDARRRACQSPAGPATPGSVAGLHDRRPSRRSSSTGFDCRAACDPRRSQSDRSCAADVKVADFAKALRADRRHDAAPARTCRKPASPRRRRDASGRDASRYADARGRRLRRAAARDARYVVTLDAGLHGRSTARRSATPGSALVENWHRTAFTSFGDGHGVWEASGGTLCRSTRATCSTSRSGRRRSTPTS